MLGCIRTRTVQHLLYGIQKPYFSLRHPLRHRFDARSISHICTRGHDPCPTWPLESVRWIVSVAQSEDDQILGLQQRKGLQHEELSVSKGRTVLDCLHELGIGKQAVERACKMDPTWLSRASAHNFQNIVNFLFRYGLSKKELETLIRKAPLIFTCSSEQKLEKRFRDLTDLNVDDKGLRRILRRCPSILSLNYENTILPKIFYLESIGLDRKSVGKIICSFPDILSCSLEHSLKPKVQFFETLGLERKAIAKMLLRCPTIAGCSIVRNIKPTIRFLESLGIEKEGIVQIMAKCPTVIGFSIKNKLMPTVKFLEESGLTRQQVAKQLTKWPQTLARSINGCLSDRLKFFSQLGFDADSNQYAKVLGVTLSLSLDTLEGKIDHLMKYGLLKDDVAKIIVSQPVVLRKSRLDISSKMKFLSSILKHPASDLVKNPTFLLYSLENRIKPRLRLMSWLHERGLVRMKYNFSTIVRMSQKEFLDRFVSLHPQAVVLFNEKEEIEI